VTRLPAERILTLTDWNENEPYNEHSQLCFSVFPAMDKAATETRSVTVQAFTDVNEWFTFHEDESEHEQQDQSMLETCWQRLHKAIPELGGDIEVIETASPRTFYEQTRRKLGLLGAPLELSAPTMPAVLGHRTSLPNLFRVGDTAFPGVGLAAVTYSALIVANELTR
jgi:prolycopene isomerase